MAVDMTSKTNEFDTETLRKMMTDVAADPAKAKVTFGVKTGWTGGCRSQTHVDAYELAGERIERDWTIDCDEPAELLGADTAPNPQELLMAGFNSCMLVGYVAGASMMGIQLERLEIETHGQLDLRGFLGTDDSVLPGYDEIHYTVRIKGNGTPEQFAEIHDTVMAKSPNRWNLSHPIRLMPTLIVE